MAERQKVQWTDLERLTERRTNHLKKKNSLTDGRTDLPERKQVSEGKLIVVLFLTNVVEPPPSRFMAFTKPKEMSNVENSCKFTPDR